MSSELRWQKSSYSGAEGPNCVEVATDADAALMRESDAPGISITTRRTRLAALIASIKAGRLR
ncbi:DUF397 domain-containing protein [Streptomyces abikoensis]|uniref:DUF397 domain-containing protein n=1 Tax=Streptomyces abikoensis TaxID=97398 RepID=UPI00369CAD30